MILLGDSAKVLKDFNSDSIDLTVTSPPYDDLRSYGGYSFDFETIARELYRVTKQGGVIVWIVGDQTKEYNESGTSFKQALYFKEIGFKLFDTMIYLKSGCSYPHPNRYYEVFEYMFIFTKGKPKTFNPIIDRNTFYGGTKCRGRNTKRQIDGSFKVNEDFIRSQVTKRTNVWYYSVGMQNSTSDKIAFKHPAIFPEKLAEDHIKSWSNEGDLILDPFLGSGTTYKMALKNNRKPIGIEINPEYIRICKQRLIFPNQVITKFI